ncbi:unnamed protein product [Clonostachys byssicola]|uniref:CHAT domain-containing protein n=1 Tax=Clonostachys byssicola TaxID=160290 RepID=A0A9N9UYH1_9HYPO|nr:unnamed protein product [Clonostachys byssicola]
MSEMTSQILPVQASGCNDIGVQYDLEYQRTGDIRAINASIHEFQKALDSTSPDDPIRPGQQFNLAVGYLNRFRKRGDLEDLNYAIQLNHQALKGTPSNSEYRTWPLHNLSGCYRERYQRQGAPADLDYSIQLGRESLQRTPPDDVYRARMLESLSLSYLSRFRRLGALRDLNYSIELSRAALAQTPTDDPSRSYRLHCLAANYGTKFRQLGVLEDLNNSIQLGQEALDYTLADDLNQSKRLTTLAIGYRDRFRRLKLPENLKYSITLYKSALEKSIADDPDRARRLQGLAANYIYRFRQGKALIDLDHAIEIGQEALGITSANDPTRAQLLHNLASTYVYRYQERDDTEDLNYATQMYQKALDSSASPVLDRIHGSSFLLLIYGQAEDWTRAYEAAYTTTSLIPKITQRFLENSDKQRRIAAIVGLSSDAAAIALNAGKSVYEAIRLQELGRGIIADSLNGMRLDISELRGLHPELAYEFFRYNDELAKLAVSPSQDSHPDFSMAASHEIDQRYNTGLKLEQVIETIRSHPGFERFLLAPNEDEMKRAAILGPVVIINVSRYRCDALIVERHGLRLLQLHDLHEGDIKHYAATLDSISVTTQLLEWLWDTIAGPVLDFINFTQSPAANWPRIWWIPTGPLAKFPIHAAGYHDSGSNTVLDRVVSNYSSSIKALFHFHENQLKVEMPGLPEKAVLVGMQNTPGQTTLPFASQEVNELKGICASLDFQVCMPQPNVDDILSSLRDCEIFHFAGHGETDPSDPSNSAIVLEDGKITVASLLQRNLYARKPFVAYLSACSTGRMKNSDLMDEGLHLIAACQLAGFQHVIGTLWEVNDKSCVEIARRTYEQLRLEGINHRSIGEGLHHACRSLRSRWITENEERGGFKRGEGLQKVSQNSTTTRELKASEGEVRNPRDIMSCDELPLYWVPYVHFGI